LKAIEIARFAEALAGEAEEPFGFRKGARIQHLVEAIQRSSDAGQWVTM
jgi:predicted dehydrogenase